MTPFQAARAARSLRFQRRMAERIPDLEAALTVFLQQRSNEEADVDGFHLALVEDRVEIEAVPITDNRQNKFAGFFEEDENRIPLPAAPDPERRFRPHQEDTEMDVRCCNCGEPWDQYFLRHDLKDQEEVDPGSLAAEGWKFGSSRLVVLRCPSCPKDGSALPDASERAATSQAVADLLGDDEDGLAAELEDMDLFFPARPTVDPPRDDGRLFAEADRVFSYTRAQAIADGVLVDVSETAKEAGFRTPVAATRALWDGYIMPAPLMKEEGQSVTGRLWDVLNVLRVAIRAAPDSTTSLAFVVLFRMPSGTQTVCLKAICAPGDHAEPVITIMLPDED